MSDHTSNCQLCDQPFESGQYVVSKVYMPHPAFVTEGSKDAVELTGSRSHFTCLLAAELKRMTYTSEPPQ